ncbi:UNVERIFIED_CONTAM: Ubiquitin carboxyl-terminal hydrolase 12 [Sesamum radiatum]|uniref:ubiquitinyl hydrolase 1 n=1 Tax=Sesamum radiatum TaxID=300843 RepID=A0AAW2JYK8_SESRA
MLTTPFSLRLLFSSSFSLLSSLFYTHKTAEIRVTSISLSPINRSLGANLLSMTLLTPPPIDVLAGLAFSVEFRRSFGNGMLSFALILVLGTEDDEMLVPHAEFAPEGPQPMEGSVALPTRRNTFLLLPLASGEPPNTVETQAVDDPPSARFTWTIENFSKLNVKKQYSEVFLVGGYKWRVLIFPKGNNVDHLSMYLDVADSGNLPYGWSRYAQFSLSVVNQIQNKYTIRKDTQHQFNSRESDWGFTSFMPLSELYDPGRGYLVNDTCIVEADVAVRRVVDYWSHDSKKETGYVGLKNQGATCYMNSLLQTLYHIPYFRKAVYHMPTTENDNPSGSIPLALQSLFYKLQYSDTSVATKELTKSFGNSGRGTIQQLFEGHHMNYIECINVDYKSTRKESFYDLQLDVKGCKDIYASFDKYVEVERLEGDNKYHAEQYGLQLPQTNPGFNNSPFKFTKYSNAYMLVYIRESDKEKIICNVDEKDIAEHLRIRLKKEQEEKEQKRKEKAEAHLYTIIKEEVAKEFGIPVQFQRFWLWAKRQNHTYRPNRPLTPQEEAQSDMQPIPPMEKTKEDILLFFKLYDPIEEKLRYVGRLFVKGNGKPMEILKKLNEMAGFAPDEEIELFEEIKFEPSVMCEHIDKKLSFRGSQLEDGDIICFQKCPQGQNSEECRYPTVPAFLDYVHNRQVVRFRSLEKPKEDEFCLELSKHNNYDEVVESVARHLGLDDPSKIRLTSHNCYSQQPKPQPIKYRGAERLTDMLVHYNQISDILYYEVLDIPLPELQGLKTLKVAFHHATKDEVVIHTIRLPKQSTVGDVISDLKTKRRDVYGAWEQYLGLEHSDNAPKRSYAANQNRHTFEKPVRIYN